MQLGGVGKNRDSRPISGFSRVVNAATPDAPDRGKLVTSLVSGVFCCSRETDDDMFMTRSLNVTPKTTEQNLIVRSDKSEAELTNK